MTFPAVAATNVSNSVSTTSHSVSLPASISSGDLLIIGLYLSDDAVSNPPTISTPSGWTSLGTTTDGTRRLSLFYKVASGSEGDSVTVTTNITATGSHNSYRITGYSSVPESATATGAGVPNPPNLTPSWGALDTLWLAWGGDTNDAQDMTAPTNYTNIIQDGTSINLGSARRNLNASSENPGTFGGSLGVAYVAATVAVQPAGDGQPIVKRMGGVEYAHSSSRGLGLGGPRIW